MMGRILSAWCPWVLASCVFLTFAIVDAGCGGGSKGGAVIPDAAVDTDDDAHGEADVNPDLGEDYASPPCPEPDLDSDGDGTPDCLDEDDDDDGFPDYLDCAPLDPSVSYGALEICDGLDQNCNLLVDEGFPDSDLDGNKDCVDDDDDDDLIPDWDDNCPVDENPGQEDADGDDVGDPCDPDDDDDGVEDDTDNCPLTPNTPQADADEDGFGDACDACPDLADGGVDADGDGVGDACDAFPYDGTEAFDHDFDGIGDNEDGNNFDFGVLSYSYDLPDAGVGEDLGEMGDLWPASRHDRAGTGASLGAGDLSTPVAASRMFLGGLVDPHGVDVADINGDGKEEVIMVSGGRVIAFRPDGSVLWSTPVLGAGVQLLRGAADLDGNGTTELVVLRISKPGGFWILRGATGSVAFAEEDWAGDPLISADMILDGALQQDVTGDGLWELALVGSSPTVLVRVRVYSFATGIDTPLVIHHWDTDASMVGQTMIIGDVDGDTVLDLVLQNGYGTVEILPLDGEEISVAGSAPVDWLASILALRDLDGDGDDEIFSLRKAGTSKPSSIRVLDWQDGGLVELWSDFTDGGADTQVIYPWTDPLADMDGDGDLDLVLSVLALLWDSDESLEFDTQNVNAISAADLAAGGPGIVVTSSIKVLGLQVTGTDPWDVDLLWQRDANAPTAPVILDLDNDGWDDVVYWAGNDGLVALNGETGTPLWVRRYKGGDELPPESPLVGPPLAAPVAGDVDGDGSPDLLAASSDGFLYCMTPDAAGELKWTIFFGVRLFSPILADLDGLGHLEVFQQTGDGFLYMLDQIGQ